MEEKQTPASIYKPDLSLKRKLGNVDISKLIDEDVVKKVEQVMESSADKILTEVSGEIANINRYISIVKDKGQFSVICKSELVAAAFSVKSKAGICGYPLISALAKSLYLFCETRKDNEKLTKQELDIISWHGEAISAILAKQLKEDDNDFARELQSELEKIKATFIK
jgi:hypothetical protein